MSGITNTTDEMVASKGKIKSYASISENITKKKSIICNPFF